MKIVCKPRKHHGDGYDNPRKNCILWKKALPFVVNPRGVLIHRSRSVVTFIFDGKVTHSHVDYWCENGCNFHENVLTDDPPKGRILCVRCEANAVAHGEEPADKIAGRHVCVGGVKAFRICCQNGDN